MSDDRGVSRVVYDAALTRVRAAVHGDYCCNPKFCACERYTLAALGLDEPPTEEATIHDVDVDVWTDYLSGGETTVAQAKCSCGWKSDKGDESDVRDAAWSHEERPPSETPKACPTCKAHREAMLSALTSLNTGPLKDGYAAAVLEDALSGIDGGTAA